MITYLEPENSENTLLANQKVLGVHAFTGGPNNPRFSELSKFWGCPRTSECFFDIRNNESSSKFTPNKESTDHFYSYRVRSLGLGVFLMSNVVELWSGECDRHQIDNGRQQNFPEHV